MKKNFNLIFLLAVLVLPIGCSSLKEEKNQKKKITQVEVAQLSEEQIQDKNEQTKKEVTQKISQLISKAKETSPDTLSYVLDDLYLKGSAASIQGDHMTAVILFSQIIKERPGDQFLSTRYAIELIRVGELKESKMILEAVHNKNKSDLKIALLLAGIETALGNKKMARKHYSFILRKDPKHEDACVFLAKSLALEKKKSEAVKVLNSCHRKDKKNPVFSYYLGKVYLTLDEMPKAVKFFKRSIAIDPTFEQGVLATGVLLEEKGKWESSLKVYKKYIDKGGRSQQVLEKLVQSYFALEKFSDVLPYAERLSKLDPTNLNIKVKLAILYTDAQEFTPAIKLFKEILSVAPKSDKILYYLGAIYQEIGDFEQSITYFQNIDSESVLYEDSSIQIAQMISHFALINKNNNKWQTRFDDYYEKVAPSLKEKKVAFHVVRANHFESLNRNDDAIKVLLEVQENEEFSDSHKYYLASLFEKNKDFKNADQVIWEIISKDSQNAHAWNFLGYSILERGGDSKQAFKYISKAVKLEPEDGYIRDSLGWYYYTMGMYKKALKELTKARSLVDDDPTISKHLGLVYQKMNKTRIAREYFVEAMSKTRDEQEIQFLTQKIADLEKQSRLPAEE